MPLVDLHVHTSASDGRYSPAEVVARAVKAGISCLAITDHDTVDGIAPALEAACAFPKLTVIPGVEINTDVASGEAHILGYFIDYNNQMLLERLREMRESRHDRAKKMIAKLEALGMPLSWERVVEIAGNDSIGRPHIALALLEKGYIASFKEAFDQYFGKKGHPAYVERTRLTPGEACELIIQAEGVPVLAHPFTLADPETMVVELLKTGLAGIEVYYGTYPVTQISRLLDMARKYALIATGGSDFHGLDEANETPMGQAGVPLKSAADLIARGRRNAE